MIEHEQAGHYVWLVHPENGKEYGWGPYRRLEDAQIVEAQLSQQLAQEAALRARGASTREEARRRKATGLQRVGSAAPGVRTPGGQRPPTLWDALEEG